MRNLFLRGSCICFYLVMSACHSTSSIKPNSTASESDGPPVEVSKLVEMPCDKLIEKSQDKSFSLRGLAGLRAHKNCKNFRYDFQLLGDLERRLYSDEIDELDPKKAASPTSYSIAELKRLVRDEKDSAEKFKFYKQLRSRQKSSGQRSEFLRTTVELFNWVRSDWKKDQKNDDAMARLYEATQLIAKTYWTEGRIEQAENILSNTLRLLKGLSSTAEIYYIKGRIADEMARYKEAVSNYDLALEDMRQGPAKTFSFTSDRIIWLKSWILYKNKQWEEAEKSFSDLALSTIDTSERSKALFFQGRCLIQLDKKVEAKAVFEKIIKDDFFSFYGLVTYNELGLKFPALSQLKFEKKFPFDRDLSFLTENEKGIFKDLIRFKEINIAERAVPILANSILDRQLNLSVYLAETSKRYLPLFASFAKLDNDSRVEVFDRYADLLFPQPYLDDVKKMSERTSIPTSLIYSIMKQESAFNEKTRSPADAMGLMQMIPRLAKHISKKFTVDYSKPTDLYNPNINIQLGSFELMEQVRRQSGQLTYVAAAYNAGPNALAGWLKTRKRSDIVEFIEEIPYDETRTYVKIIARNKLFYERISKRDEEHSFPIEFLISPVTE